MGYRMEHPQETINRAQWGVAGLPGVKAAEYRLTSRAPGRLPVYTFCMCPGGMVVPSTAYASTSIVNGMSHYARDGLVYFNRKIKGFEAGIILGLESKTSSPVQVVREKNGPCAGLANLYLVGEGSGFAGGIVSSGADGIRTAMGIVQAEA